MNSSAIRKLSDTFREKRLDMELGLDKLAEELGVSPAIIQAIEDCDWQEVPSGQEYPLIVVIAKRLDIDLRNHSVGSSSFMNNAAREEANPGDIRRERIVMFVMTTATIAMLAWLLIPAKDISQPPARAPQPPPTQQSLWQKPDTDQQYPVLGEVFPESPLTDDGALISLRATDTCNARVVMENGHEQTQVLRMSEPWKLRIKGPFVLFLDNAGVVAVEIAGRKIQHGVVVGQLWSGSFDAHGNWLRPILRSVPAIVEAADGDDGDDAEPGQLNPHC